MEILEIRSSKGVLLHQSSCGSLNRVKLKGKWCSVEDAGMLDPLAARIDAQQKWPHVSDNREEKGLCPRLHGTDRLFCSYKSLRNPENVSFFFFFFTTSPSLIYK